MEENIQGDIVQKELIESEKCLTASDYNCKYLTFKSNYTPKRNISK